MLLLLLMLIMLLVLVLASSSACRPVCAHLLCLSPPPLSSASLVHCHTHFHFMVEEYSRGMLSYHARMQASKFLTVRSARHALGGWRGRWRTGWMRQVWTDGLGDGRHRRIMRQCGLASA
jgi:hypothetical protein